MLAFAENSGCSGHVVLVCSELTYYNYNKTTITLSINGHAILASN